MIAAPAEYVNIKFNALTEAPTSQCRFAERQVGFFLQPGIYMLGDHREEWGRPHEEMEMKGAIQIKEHNDGITWDSIAMQRAKP